MSSSKKLELSPEFESRVLKLRFFKDGQSKPLFKKSLDKNKNLIGFTCLLCSYNVNTRNQNASMIENQINQHMKSKIHVENTKDARRHSFSGKNQEVKASKSRAKIEKTEVSFEHGNLFNLTQKNIHSVPGAKKITNPGNPGDTPFLGVEYVVEFTDGSKCYLCNGKNLKNTITHLKTRKHIKKYLRAHFPSILRFIGQMELRVKQSGAKYLTGKHMTFELMTESANLIREHCGTLEPNFLNVQIDSVSHTTIAESMKTGKHFCEKDPQGKKVVEILTEDYVQSLVTKSLKESLKKIFKTNQETLEEFERNQDSSEEFSEDSDGSDSESSQKADTDDSEDPNNSQRLSSTDYQVLLENFDSLEQHEQKRLSAHIQSISSEKYEKFKKILNEKCAKNASQQS